MTKPDLTARAARATRRSYDPSATDAWRDRLHRRRRRRAIVGWLSLAVFYSVVLVLLTRLAVQP